MLTWPTSPSTQTSRSRGAERRVPLTSTVSSPTDMIGSDDAAFVSGGVSGSRGRAVVSLTLQPYRVPMRIEEGGMDRRRSRQMSLAAVAATLLVVICVSAVSAAPATWRKTIDLRVRSGAILSDAAALGSSVAV